MTFHAQTCIRDPATFAKFTALGAPSPDFRECCLIVSDYVTSNLLTEKYPVVRAVERTPLDGCVRHVAAEFRESSEPRQRRPAGYYESQRNSEPRQTVTT